MNTPTKIEMRWFVSKLINIRQDVEQTVDSIVDIDFDYKDILEQESIFGITTKEEALDKIEEMLQRIKKDNVFLNSFNNFNRKDLSWKISRSGVVKIIGYQTKLLKAYLRENILTSEKIFSLKKNKKHQQAIAVYGQITNQVIESTDQFRIFCYILKNPEKVITYSKLYNEITTGRLHGADYYHNRYPNEVSKNEFIRETVYNLKRKLKVSGERCGIDVDIVLETIPKRGYIYHA